MDSDPEVCRLGYGDIEAIDLLISSGVDVRKTKGLRIGVISIDNIAWIFSPATLVVEEEPDDLHPNAVALGAEQAYALISSISPAFRMEKDLEGNKSKEYIQLSLFPEVATPEIGQEFINQDDLKNAKDNLEICPPQKFDIARRVRVYHSYVQFVDLSLTGCHLTRHTITIPPKLLNVTRSPEVQQRLKSTYSLIDKNSSLSGKEIDDELNKIRKTYLRSLGKRYGTVILRQKKDDFLEEVKKIQDKLKKFSNDVKSKLNTEFTKCRDELLKILLPGIIENPPDDLRGGIPMKKPTKKQAELYLKELLAGVVPDAEDFIKGMTLTCDFKDVTYEMLKDIEFQDALIKQYPYVDWPQPFEEYEAAREGHQ